MMKLWEKEAHQFGLPENIQKGLMFLIGFSLTPLSTQMDLESYVSFTRQMSEQIRFKPPYLAPDAGCDFDEAEIHALLVELADRHMGLLVPKRTDLPAGFVPICRRDNRNRLPEVLGRKTFLLSHWEQILTSLCDQIGRSIHGDVEDAYIVGFGLFDILYEKDPQGTPKLSFLATHYLPPHMRWFNTFLRLRPEQFQERNPISTVVGALLETVHRPTVREYVQHMAKMLHYSGTEEQNRNVLDMPLGGFTLIAATVQANMQGDTAHPGYQLVRRELLEQGFQPPPTCESLEEAAEQLAYNVTERWGFDVLHDPSPLYKGENYTRRACIMYMCILNAILNPRWNACCLNTFDTVES